VSGDYYVVIIHTNRFFLTNFGQVLMVIKTRMIYLEIFIVTELHNYFHIY
jgi:hypothetical protein